MSKFRERARVLTARIGERFTDLADWVSAAMGTPLNIGFWLGAVAVWFLIFIVNPSLQNSSFLPAWFTSQAFNFPLNSITTLAELYIGFLVAAASNRAERHLRQILDMLMQMLKQVLDIAARLLSTEKRMERMEREHGKLLAELNEVLADLHSHTTCMGHTTIGEDVPAPPQPTAPSATVTRKAKVRR